MVLPTSPTESKYTTQPARILIYTGLDTYEYSPTLRPPLPFQFPNPTAPGSEYDEAIVRMAKEGRSWGDIESATGSDAFDRYYCVLNPALKASWTPARIEQLSRVVQVHVDRWAVNQVFPTRPNDINSDGTPVSVLSVEEHIPWSEVALEFQEPGRVCRRIWIEFGNGRSLDQDPQTNQETEASKSEGTVKEKEHALQKEQAERLEQSRQGDEKTQGKAAPKEGLTQQVDLIQEPSPSTVPKSSLKLKNSLQEALSIAEKPPLPTSSLPQDAPWTIQTSKLAAPEQGGSTASKPINKGISKGTRQGHTNIYSNRTVRHTRLYTKNKELQIARGRRMNRVLQNMQLVKLAGAHKSEIVAQRNREREALLEKQDAVKKQYDSLRVVCGTTTSPWPTTRPIVFPRNLTTPFRPPLFPRYAVQSLTPRIMHFNTNSSLTSSSVGKHVLVSSSASETCATDQPLLDLSGRPLDTSARCDMMNQGSLTTRSATLPNVSAPSETLAKLSQDGLAGHAQVGPTNAILETHSSEQKNSISHVSSSSRAMETPEGSSASLSEFKIPSIADVLAEHSLMVNRTIGNKRYWATTDEETLKKLKAESEDIRSSFFALSSQGTAHPPLGGNPSPPL